MVKVTDAGPRMVPGTAVTLSFGGLTPMVTDFDCGVPLTVANTVSVPVRVNGLRHVRVGPVLLGTNEFHAQGAHCVPNDGTHLVESIVQGISRPSSGPVGDIDATTVTLSP